MTRSTWLVERNGITIGTASAPSDRIRVTVGPDSLLSPDEARELLAKALSLLGGTQEGLSATDKVLAEVLQVEIHQREVAQSKLEAALAQISTLRAENALLRAENTRPASTLTEQPSDEDLSHK